MKKEYRIIQRINIDTLCFSLAGSTHEEKTIVLRVRKIVVADNGNETLGDVETIRISITGVINNKRLNGVIEASGFCITWNYTAFTATFDPGNKRGDYGQLTLSEPS